MKKIISFILVMVICFCSQIFTVGVSAEKGRGNYKINDKGEVQVDLNIPKAQTNKYYIDQVTESVYGSTDPATRVPHLPIVRADEFEAKYFTMNCAMR